ncbi:MAG: methylenetetrahydrofolate reductase [Niabella sp.]
MMFADKVKAGQSGLLMYGITPPKSETSPERVAEIADKTIARLKQLAIDALIVYDVQDESARTSEERPFPFLKALDPFEFASGYLQELEVDKIIYRPAGKFSKEELSDWLNSLQKHSFYPVFVGVPAPDYPVKSTLQEAYQIWSKQKDTSVIGAVTIPERHALLKDEDQRILDKMSCGVSYFISQCVFNVTYAKQVVDDLIRTCKKDNVPLPVIIFTLSACGSLKTLHFMEWLGIHIPDDLKEDLKNSDDMLGKSVKVCLDIASALTAFCVERSMPFGFNIESVAIRKQEIEASVDMVHQIGDMLVQEGLRKTAGTISPA